MPTDDQDNRYGVRLGGGLPKDNGLAVISEDLVKSPTKVTFAVLSMRNKTTHVNNENGSQTASMKILGLEADLLPNEVATIQLILDRARVRRTGEQPMFDNAGMPEDPNVVLNDPKVKPLKATSSRRRS